MYAYVTDLHGCKPSDFEPGRVFVVDRVEYGAGGHQMQRVTLYSEDPQPPIVLVARDVRRWLTEALKRYPYASAHPEYVTGYDRESFMRSAELVHAFGSDDHGGGHWVIPPEDDIPALVEAWRPPERPDPRFVP